MNTKERVLLFAGITGIAFGIGREAGRAEHKTPTAIRRDSGKAFVVVRVMVNGKQYIPADGDFVPDADTPRSFTATLDDGRLLLKAYQIDRSSTPSNLSSTAGQR